MSKSEKEILQNLREEGFAVPDATAESIHDYCLRKMEVADISDREEYLPLLFEDEIKNYCIRAAVNILSMKEGEANV